MAWAAYDKDMFAALGGFSSRAFSDAEAYLWICNKSYNCQFSKSLDVCSEEWGWTKSKTQRFFNKLSKLGAIVKVKHKTKHNPTIYRLDIKGFGDAGDAKSDTLTDTPINKERKERKYIVPEDWKPSREVWEKLVEKYGRGMCIEQLASYKDWCLANGVPHANHNAAFRNWLRRSKEWKSAGSAQISKVSVQKSNGRTATQAYKGSRQELNASMKF